jgi:hypothetical protein
LFVEEGNLVIEFPIVGDGQNLSAFGGLTPEKARNSFVAVSAERGSSVLSVAREYVPGRGQ